MINKIIDAIKVSTYGRAIKGKSWTFSEKIGVNRLYYIHEGHGTFYGDNYSVKLEEGYIYIFPQSLEFNTIADEASFVDHTFFDFYLPIYSSKQVIKVKKDQISLVNKTMDCLIEIADKHPMFEILRRNDYYDAVICNIALTMFFISNYISGIEFISDYRILNALNYIQRNFNKPITTKELAVES